MTFIDLFAGCGGLSLGLTEAGWRGIFAIEKTCDAFQTFKRNFVDGSSRIRFEWPDWLEVNPHLIDDLINEHSKNLEKLRGTIDVVAGGPPCQGFSFAGRRVKSDPRNRLFEKYVEFVKLVQPKALILENVPGMRISHGASSKKSSNNFSRPTKSFYQQLVESLDEIGYVAKGQLLDAAQFGVPQRRARLVVVGIKKSLLARFEDGIDTIFSMIESQRCAQLKELGLSENVTAFEAISDLQTQNKILVPYVDAASRKGFSFAQYAGPETHYQRLMHAGCKSLKMDSMRLAKHSKLVSDRFKRILAEFRKGVNLSTGDREALGLLKHRTVPMAPDLAAPTLTTLPDDMLHFSEPRILTVRESARLQSFPDSFVFAGKYTTGGARRKVECPRYTQVGNAVPPLMARAIGIAIAQALHGTN